MESYKSLSIMRVLKLVFFTLFFCGLFIVITVSGISSGVAYGVLTRYKDTLPSIDSAGTYNPPQVSEVYSDDGTLLGRFYKEKRWLIPFEEIPQNMIYAIITAEDNQFYAHHGLNVRGIFRAFLQNMKAGKVVQGGSTITQQLTRTLFLTRERSYARKIEEALLALKLEKKFTKNKILELYLNAIYFGHRAYGLEAAAHIYFGKHARELTLSECALLAGLPRAPSFYSPYRNPERARKLRDTIIQRMYELDYISADALRAAHDEDLGLVPLTSEEWTAPYFVEYVRQQLELTYGPDKVTEGGLRVYTTLNLRMQKIAEKALRWGLAQHQKRLGRLNPLSMYAVKLYESNQPEEGNVIVGSVNAVESKSLGVEFPSGYGTIPRSRVQWIRNWDKLEPGQAVLIEVLKKTERGDGGYDYELDIYPEPEAESALMAIDPRDGSIKAMVGGYDYARNNFNRATQAKRQPGSAFKPIICSAALDNGYSPAAIIYDTPIIEDIPGTRKPWKPVNFDGTFQGPMTLRQAMEKSRNVVMIKLLKNLGVDIAIRYGEQFGIKSKLEPHLSLALGTSVVTLEDLISAYTVFCNLGKHATPYSIKSVVDSRGDVLQVSVPEVSEVLPDTTAFLINNILQGIVEHGTGRKARSLGRHLAGKTGTTDDYKDAWFMGFAPNLLTGVWVGFDDFNTLGRLETGARAALPIWIEFMKGALENSPVLEFQEIDKDKIVWRTIDYDTGLLATSKCQNVILEAFKRGTEPAEYCNAHTLKRNFSLIDLDTTDAELEDDSRPKRKLFSSD